LKTLGFSGLDAGVVTILHNFFQNIPVVFFDMVYLSKTVATFNDKMKGTATVLCMIHLKKEDIKNP
jgi:3'-phosphoadenosine 5'-phosphosulfate sulfotransferase (PAPS reductase)/FAD synthetase